MIIGFYVVFCLRRVFVYRFFAVLAGLCRCVLHLFTYIQPRTGPELVRLLQSPRGERCTSVYTQVRFEVDFV